jgi:acetyltransferase-like isoleucine patch superfamily enzyme
VWPPLNIWNRHRIALGEDVLIEKGARFAVAETSIAESKEILLTIGNRTHFGQRMIIVCAGSVVIGDDVLAADNVFICDTYHEYRNISKPVAAQGNSPPRPVRIGDGAFLGVYSVILPGVQIGKGAYIGAGAVVTRDIPAHCVAVGNPARVVRYWDHTQGAWMSGDPRNAVQP